MRRRLVALLAGAAMLLSGCTAIPTSGPVEAAPVQDDGSTQVVYPVPNPPAAGADPQTLVEAFIQTLGSGGRDNFAAARKYLTTATEATWNPLEGTTIYATSGVTTAPADAANMVVVRVPVLAYLDKHGRYTPAEPGTSEAVEFFLVKDGANQWRIDRLPDRNFIELSLFTSLYRQIPLYWVSADQSGLIPEARFFPVSINQAAFIVAALLAGPSAWLQGAVFPTLPELVTLTVNSVPTENGNALVDLKRSFLGVPEMSQRMFLAQLNATLLRVSSITQVTVTVEGGPITVAPLSSLTLSSQSGPGPFVVSGGRVDWLKSDAARPIEVAVGPQLSALAADEQATTWVGLSEAGVVLASDNNRLVIRGNKLVAPAIDRFGWIWTGKITNMGSLQLAPPAALVGPADVLTVEVPWLAGATLIAVKPSWDGNRVALAYTDDSGVHVVVVGVVRLPGGDIAQLTQPLAVGVGVQSVSALTWSGITQLSALGTRPDKEAVVFRLDVGGPTTTIALTGAVALAAGTHDPSLYVLDENGVLYARTAGAWQEVMSGVHMVGFAG